MEEERGEGDEQKEGKKVWKNTFAVGVRMEGNWTFLFP